MIIEDKSLVRLLELHIEDSEDEIYEGSYPTPRR